MKFSLFADSRVGGRAHNEDRLGHRATGAALVMVLADGLGGHGHGEVAAEAAVRSILATFEQQARPRLADPQRFLADALAGAHTAILAQRELRNLDDQPRTTCVVCVVQDGVACWAHAGDSRLYLLRNGRVLARTRDHSHVQALIDAGQVAEDAARTHPARNALTSCLGGHPEPRFEFSGRTPLRRGDIVLLCSDGVWGAMPDDAPLALLSLRNAVKAAPGLLDRVEAMAGIGSDNLSLIAMAWEEDAPPAAAPRAWSAEDFERTLNTTTDRLHAKETP